MASSSTKARMRRSTRQLWSAIGEIGLTVVVIVGSLWLANAVTQRLLGGLAHAPALMPSLTLPTPSPTAAVVVLPSANAVSVGIGATQSFHSLAITLTNLRIVSKQGFVGAPQGMAFALITVVLVNTDPIISVAYSPTDFALVDAAGTAHPAAFAALGAPLGTGEVPPLATVQGDLAFLIPYPVDGSQPDPQIRYLPSAANSLALSWGLPLAPLLP